jgi:hypothetical protein
VGVVNTFRTQTKSWLKKTTTVEQCLSLPVGMFTKGEISGGALEWRSAKSVKAVFSVTHLADKISHKNDPYLLLQHANQDPLARGETLSYRVQLVATEPVQGGQRWCFWCPGSVSGKPCNRIVRKLYLHQTAMS